MLAPIATAYEQAMTEGEGKNTWRTDRYSPCPRQEAGHYLAFLASIGYGLSGIEQAVTTNVPFADDASADEALAPVADGGPRGGGDGPGAGESVSTGGDVPGEAGAAGPTNDAGVTLGGTGESAA